MRPDLIHRALFASLLVVACDVKEGVLTNFHADDESGTGGDPSHGSGHEVTGAPEATTAGPGDSIATTDHGEEIPGTSTTGVGTTDHGEVIETTEFGTTGDEVGDDSTTVADSTPPFDTFSPVGDVGDGVLLGDEMLLIADTPDGRLTLWWTPERLGDTVQGFLGPAAFVDGAWGPVGEAVWLQTDIGPVVDNVVPLQDALVLPEDTHPFGPGAIAVDVFLEAFFYADKLLCGHLDLAGSDAHFIDLVFVTKKVAEFGAQAEPPLTCE